MADENVNDVQATPADIPNKPKSGIEDLPEWAQQEIKANRAEAAKYRTRAKEFADDNEYQRAKDALSKLDALEQASKSEAQKLTEERERLLTEVSKANTELIRYRTAVKAGFAGEEAEDIASRLRGDDEDSLFADAQKLRDLIRPQEKPPKADPSQGRVSGSETPGSIFAEFVNQQLG